MKNIFLFGECMIELRQTTVGSMEQSFAGDVFNTAVYLKRVFSDIDTHLVTAIGKDAFSESMLNYFHQENISTEFVFHAQDKIPGLYAIQTDEHGERSFTYWRDNSAAREVMTHIDDNVITQLSLGDMFFFSGISLAVIQPADRNTFWELVKRLKNKGVKIVFDPNYRARMWESPTHAKAQFEQAFQYADIALPGVDDFEQLYGINTAEQVLKYCQKFSLQELIIKNGAQSIFCFINNQAYHFDVAPVLNVIDTTSAGDSFNGLYLGARMKGFTVSDSVALASSAAAFVIQHKGAIVSSSIFQEFITQKLYSSTR